MQKRMQHQGGWAVTFVVVGVLLLAGLVGGVYYLKTRTADQLATNEDATSEVEKTLEDASSDSEDNKSETQKPEQDKSASSAEDSVTPQSDKSPKQAAPQNTAALPETGPADALAKLVAVTALTVASVAYLRSR